MTDLATAIVQRRRAISICFVLVGLALLPFAPRLSATLEVGGSDIKQSEAGLVERILATDFDTPFAENLILVVTGIPSVTSDNGLDSLIEIVAAISEMENVEKTLSYIDAVDPVFVSEHGTFIIVGLAVDERRVDDTILAMREASQALRNELMPAHPDIELFWTGAAAFDHDVRLASATDATDAERRVFPLTLLLLIVVFGSIVSALCPIVIAGVGVALSFDAAVLIAPFWPMTILLENIVTMIGLGIGIDYCLLLLGRFREELAVNADTEQAAIRALRTAGHTIVLSGSAVAIGFASLLLVPATELRSIAAGGLLVVMFSVCLATLLLPGLLVWFGSKLEIGRLWRPRDSGASSIWWRSWGIFVTAHPLLVLIIAGLPVAGLASQARYISTDIPTGSWLPAHMESTRGVVALSKMGYSGIVQTIRVVIEFPDGTSADSAVASQTILDLGEFLERDNRVSRIDSLPKLLGVEDGEQASRAYIQPELRRSFIDTNSTRALLEILPRESASAGDLMRLVREVRGIETSRYSAGGETRLLVGGLPANNADYQDAVGGGAKNVIAVIVVGSLLALMLGFKSVLCAVKAVALNLLSVAAAMGATVIVFQYGYGAELLGVSEPLDGLFPAVPIIVFCVVYGLSMDYEVFLLSRVAESVSAGTSNDDAIVNGLARTGSIITSAALVMIVVFAGFALGDFLIVKILGFALATAIVIDATAVRMAIGPALMKLGGKWNWWPGIR
jgi:RND superfamily putative drug exporter